MLRRTGPHVEMKCTYARPDSGPFGVFVAIRGDKRG
jgi:hypothetical protein